MEEIEYELMDIDNAAKILLQKLGNGRKVAVNGTMGAGKTTLITAVCRALGVSEAISSPTFSIANVYSLPDSDEVVYHLDLYRLKNVQEAIDIDIFPYLEDPNYCFIEWPDLIESLLPPDVIQIELELVNESQRKILFL